jgi:hypothetical protein
MGTVGNGGSIDPSRGLRPSPRRTHRSRWRDHGEQGARARPPEDEHDPPVRTVRAGTLERIECPAGWMSPASYARYLRTTLANMRRRSARERTWAGGSRRYRDAGRWARRRARPPDFAARAGPATPREWPRGTMRTRSPRRSAGSMSQCAMTLLVDTVSISSVRGMPRATLSHSYGGAGCHHAGSVRYPSRRP